MRHPALRVLQSLCSFAAAALLAAARPAPQPPAPVLWLSALGEVELADGSWQGVDLLTRSDRRIDRFQVTLQSEAPVRLRLEAVTAQGTEQLWPAHPGEALVEAGRAVALPGPRSFFELRGEAQLRVVVGSQGQAPLAPQGGAHAVRYPLSDGASSQVVERSFDAQGGALAIALHGG